MQALKIAFRLALVGRLGVISTGSHPALSTTRRGDATLEQSRTSSMPVALARHSLGLWRGVGEEVGVGTGAPHTSLFSSSHVGNSRGYPRRSLEPGEAPANPSSTHYCCCSVVRFFVTATPAD